ncbi:hypothetical protein JCM21900_006421 [Sporobolomyces salmonicolor]
MRSPPSHSPALPSPASSTDSPSRSPFKSLFRPRLQPLHLLPSRPLALEEATPTSPSILLSPCTPDFPAVALPDVAEPSQGAKPEPQSQAQPSTEQAPLKGEDDDESEELVHKTNGMRGEQTVKRMDPTLRHSLRLLDSRLAELESLGFGAASLKQPSSGSKIEGAPETIEEEDVERLAGEESPANASYLSGRAPFSVDSAKVSSVASLASVASGTSMHSSSDEDAFDIADFPSLDQLALSSTFDLGPMSSSRSKETQRNRSSDLMAFPIPPSDVPLIPLASPSADTTEDDERVFEQLASLGERDRMQGLGLFSSIGTAAARPSYSSSRRPTTADQSEFDADGQSISSSIESSLDASTLASSVAPTLGFGRSTTSFHSAEKHDFPVELSMLPLYARRGSTMPPHAPPPSIVTSAAARSNAVPAALGAPFALQLEDRVDFVSSPTSLSPYSFSDSPFARPPSPTTSSPVRALSPRSSSLARAVSLAPSSPNSSRAPSRAESNLDSPAEMHLASLDLLGDFDFGGIPLWEVRPEDGYHDAQEQLQDPMSTPTLVEPPKSAPKVTSVPSSPASPMSAIRRLSSFTLLKKRKSGVTLSSTPTSSPKPTLAKPKSELALSTLAKRQAKDQEKHKENAAPSASPALSTSSSRFFGRSASSPRLSKFASPATGTATPPPKIPASSSSIAPSPRVTGFSARPRALSYSSQDESSTKEGKKRFSIISKQFRGGGTESVPPVPPTPTQHLPAVPPTTKARGANIVIDVAKANELEVLTEASAKPSISSPTPTLEISTPAATASPSSASFPPTPTSCKAASQLSPPSLQSDFTFPPLPSPTTSVYSSFSCPTEDRRTLSTFLHSTTPDQLVKRPARSSSIFPPMSPARTSSSNGESRPTTPFGDRTNWSRPTSPGLLDALKGPGSGLDKMVVSVQDVTVFPVRLPPAPPGVLADEEGEDSGEDDYGTDTDSDEDKPLGIVVPGALTAQKSLRYSQAKKSRGDKKLKASSSRQAQRPNTRGVREDPFELEQTAAMVATPPMSAEGESAPPRPSKYSRLEFLPPFPTSSAVLETPYSQSTGHDSLLPQTDASIERKALSNGLKRSPSMPLDPMIANSALTLDSPLLSQELLHTQRPQKDVAPSRSKSLPTKKPNLHVNTGPLSPLPLTDAPRSPAPVVPAPTRPSVRPPPLPSPSSLSSSANPQAVLSRRPSAAAEPPSTLPSLSRRPSLHPDVAHLQPSSSGMQRHVSNSSTKSNASQLHRQPTTSRARAATVSLPTTEHRVFVGDGSTPIKVNVSERTLAGEVVAYAKGKGVLKSGNESEGGWALWEVWRGMGLERPIREYEFVHDVVKSFDDDSSIFVLKRTAMWPILSSSARLHTAMPRRGAVQLEVKKGKWSKRFLDLKDGALSYSKSEKGKDATVLCQLSNFDVFFVTREAADRLKAPKPFVFALKSRLTRAHFEEANEYCHFLSIKTAEEMLNWIKTITEAGNSHARQREQAILGTSSAPPMPTSPLLASSPIITSAPFSLTSSLVSAIPTSTPLTTATAPRPLGRNPSARPAPAILSQPVASPSVSTPPTLSRQGTVVKPDSRQWGAMDDRRRQKWLKESERAAKQTKTPLVDLSR